MASINTYYYRYSTGNLLHRYTKHNGTSYTDDYTIVYNYYTLSEEETTYNNLFNQEKEKLIELTKTFIKKSIEPIEK